jgi:hypothetical protein
MKALIIAAVLAASTTGFAAEAQSHASSNASGPAPMITHPIPSVVQKDGRYALMVDGAPYLMLGAQSGNSSNWPATLLQVWPAIEYLHANTLEIPIYWEQFEPKPGHLITHRWTCC